MLDFTKYEALRTYEGKMPKFRKFVLRKLMKKFKRTIEDFSCENCGAKVKGTGYTNHCPKCLFSKHVDINPGDRQEPCGGLMEPVGLRLEKGRYIITHRCQICGTERNNHAAENDSTEAFIKLSETLAKKALF